MLHLPVISIFYDLFQESFHLIRFSSLFLPYCYIFSLFWNLCLIFHLSTFILIFLLSAWGLLFSVYCYFIFVSLYPPLCAIIQGLLIPPFGLICFILLPYIYVSCFKNKNKKLILTCVNCSFLPSFFTNFTL
jgi:hypothetical protein